MRSQAVAPGSEPCGCPAGESGADHDDGVLAVAVVPRDGPAVDEPVAAVETAGGIVALPDLELDRRYAPGPKDGECPFEETGPDTPTATLGANGQVLHVTQGFDVAGNRVGHDVPHDATGRFGDEEPGFAEVLLEGPEGPGLGERLLLDPVDRQQVRSLGLADAGAAGLRWDRGRHAVG